MSGQARQRLSNPGAAPLLGSPSESHQSSSKLPMSDKQARLLTTDTGHFSMARALHMADYITELNGFCGVSAVFFCLRFCLDEQKSTNWLYSAIVAMAMGLFFDFMDGRVARWRKKASMLGQELDSLADLISFGLAPAALAFCVGFRSAVDTIFLTFFVLCGLTRLARFNVTAQILPKDESGKAKYFEGTPIPTTLALDFFMAYLISKDRIIDTLPGGVIGQGQWFEFHPLVAIFLIHGSLMVSRTIQIPKP